MVLKNSLIKLRIVRVDSVSPVVAVSRSLKNNQDCLTL